MNKDEFNKLSERKIKTLLQGHPDKANIIEALLGDIGEEVREFWLCRKIDKGNRLIDDSTGRYASTFTANGNKYRVVRPKEGIGLKRYTEFTKLFTMLGFNMTFGNMLKLQQKAQRAYNSLVTKEPDLIGLGEAVANWGGAIQEQHREWDYSYWAATFFILKEGENKLSPWVEEEAEEKIKDWHEEGLHEADFFTLAMLWGKESAEIRQKSLSMVTRAAGRL